MSTLKLKRLQPFGYQVTFPGHDVSKIRELLLDTGLVLIKNANLFEDSELLELAEALSFKEGTRRERVLHWEFGPVMKMAFDPKAKNYLFSDEDVPFHWDGAFHVEPQFLIFSCLESSGAGGETLFTNTERIWNDSNHLEQEVLSQMELSFKTEKRAHYGGQIRVPVVQTHPLKGTPVLRFAEEVETSLNPVKRNVHSTQENAQLYLNNITLRVYDERYCFSHTWESGDLLIVDNFSCVHGRRALGPNRKRSFKRVQVL